MSINSRLQKLDNRLLPPNPPGLRVHIIFKQDEYEKVDILKWQQ